MFRNRVLVLEKEIGFVHLVTFCSALLPRARIFYSLNVLLHVWCKLDH